MQSSSHTQKLVKVDLEKKKESGKKAQAGGVSISRPPATCPAIRCVLVSGPKTILIASVLT